MLNAVLVFCSFAYKLGIYTQTHIRLTQFNTELKIICGPNYWHKFSKPAYCVPQLIYKMYACDSLTITNNSFNWISDKFPMV